MSRVLRTSTGVIGGVSLLGLLASVANAALFLVLTETTGPAGTVVRGDTAGNHAFAQQVGDLIICGRAHEILASLLLKTDDVRGARREFERAHDLFVAKGYVPGEERVSTALDALES